MEKKVILSIKNISKSFPGVKVLDDISVDFCEGEVHAIMGENGAGKSTFMNILNGVYPSDGGTITVNGEKVEFTSPVEAMEKGIAMIHQENSLIPHMSVAENIYLGRAPKKGVFIDRKSLNEQARTLMKTLNLEGIDPSEEVFRYGVAQKQMIEILKALSQNPRVLMMDEPTAALTAKETEALMRIIEKLKADGVCILYVSHRMEEVLSIADKITVLRDGKFVSASLRGEKTQDEIINDMVGRDLSDQMEALENFTSSATDEVVMKVEGFSAHGKYKDVSFELHKGEVLGFGGLVGAGRTEIVESIFGFEPHDEGELYLYGEKVNIKHPKDAIEKGIGLVSEERKVKGLFLVLSVKENINVASYPSLVSSPGVLSRKKEKTAAENGVKDLNIKTTTIAKKIMELSGGNQQKAIISRWMNTHPNILIMDEPTHGIDVGAKAEVYALIRRLAQEGMSVILISSEMPELLMLSDRIAVMSNGRLTGILDRNEATQEKIMSLAVQNSMGKRGQ